MTFDASPSSRSITSSPINRVNSGRFDRMNTRGSMVSIAESNKDEPDELLQDDSFSPRAVQCFVTPDVTPVALAGRRPPPTASVWRWVDGTSSPEMRYRLRSSTRCFRSQRFGFFEKHASPGGRCSALFGRKRELCLSGFTMLLEQRLFALLFLRI
jgi:hypothetical protein